SLSARTSVLASFLLSLLLRPPPSSTLFPYTTLFRSMLVERGCRLTVVPAQTPAKDVLALKPDGVFLSNGPGDPEPCDYAVRLQRSEEHTSELQSRENLVCRLLLEKKKKNKTQ